MDNISFEDFKKLDIRIAKVIDCVEVEGTEKLLRLTLSVGDLGERTIVSGIKPWYTPEELIGKKIVYLANLEPKEIKGNLSCGMLLAAEDDEGNCVLLVPLSDISEGCEVR